MDCLVQPQNSFWTGVVPHGLPSYQRNYFSNFYFPGKGPFGSPFYPGTGLFFPHDDDVDYPTDIKGEMAGVTMPYPCMADDNGEFKMCVVCGEREGVASTSACTGLFFPHDDDVDYPTDIKGEMTGVTMSYPCMADDNGEFKMCVVCGERASGFYFGALVCLPCKSFYIRCTKDGEPSFTCQCSGNCDIVKQGRIRCQYCRYQRCLMAGMCRKEKPETVQPAEGQVLCKVCGDIANGIHFGVNTCEGCKKFFRRGLVENQSYVCKGEKDCGINPRNRNNCRYCRYQKCLNVGMSREAIKMGRPKKADGNDVVSPSVNSPKSDQQLLADVDSVSNLTNLSSGPQGLEREDQTHDPLNNASVSNKVKEENERPSCEYMKKMANCYQGNMSPWQQGHQGQINNNSVQTPGQTNATEFIEEEMDEILMMLQNDNNNNNSREYSGNKKMRCFDYSAAMRQRDVKADFVNNTMSQSQWTNMNEPMNMTMNMSTRGPPPQYPGYSPEYHQTGVTPPPCNSPIRQIHSPGSGYMSDSSVQSPGYMSAGSPGYMSSASPHPACQYSPEHSPVYQSLSSPQHSPYQSECGSPQGSPYSDQMYQPATYNNNTHNYVHDLSVNVNMAPISPAQASPSFTHNNNNSHHMTGQTNTSNMTIPSQEGGVTSHDSWCLAGSPPHYCHSPSQTRPATLPHQERGYSNNPHASSMQENLQRINNHFMRPAYDSSELSLVHDNDITGAVTRNDIEREVVCKTLASVSPSDSYFYVMTDHQSCSSDSSSNYDEFTSCRRINKRKNCDDTDMCDTQGYTGFQVGRYKRQLTETYWQSATLVSESLTMTADKQALLDHLQTNYKQMVNKYTDSIKPTLNGPILTMTADKQALLDHLQTNYKQMVNKYTDSIKPTQDGRNWQQIQMRIVKNTSSGVKFASQIPGFSSLHPDDKTFLCKNVTFMATLLMAGHQLYNPIEKNFRDFWSWSITPQNPFYPFKQKLIELGDKIYKTNMDMYEIASLAALMYMATDFTDLVYPESIKDARRKIMVALQSYELAKGADVKSRMSELLSLVPEIRHAGMWHHELMKQMKVNIQMKDVHQLFELVQYRES